MTATTAWCASRSSIRPVPRRSPVTRPTIRLTGSRTSPRRSALPHRSSPGTRSSVSRTRSRSTRRRTPRGVWKTSKSYAYGANGENLSLVDTPVNTTTSEKSFYGTNAHGDVETLTDASTGTTTSTYRYTAYGQPDKVGTTGDDAITGNDPIQDADIVNPYRFNGSRFDGATGTYDMGFREYNPGLNRFATRDLYAGALKDMALGSDPWNANRYMFGGGNPISRVELDGHLNREEGAGGGGFIVGPVLERCPKCQLRLKDGGGWVFEGDASGDIVDTAKPLLHATLDGLGLVPGAGEVADGANCAWYAHDRETGNAIASCAAMIPFYGWMSTTGKWFGKGTKLSDEAAAAEKAAADACRANSFTGDTPVLMADGSKKPIRDVKLGDKVLASDPGTGETGPRKIIDLIRHSGPHTMVAVRLADGTTIDATDHHPFWVASRGWVDAIDLQVADVLTTADGRALAVGGVGVSERDLTAYNLTVAGLHTYFAGEDAVLVHNSGGIDGCSDAAYQGVLHVREEIAREGAGGVHSWAANMSDELADYLDGFVTRGGGQAFKDGSTGWYDADRGVMIVQRSEYSMTGYSVPYSDFLGKLR